MKKSVLTLIMFSLLSLIAYAEPPPAKYKEAVKQQIENRFNENEIISFVYKVYAMYDRHVPVAVIYHFLHPGI